MPRVEEEHGKSIEPLECDIERDPIAAEKNEKPPNYNPGSHQELLKKFDDALFEGTYAATTKAVQLSTRFYTKHLVDSLGQFYDLFGCICPVRFQNKVSQWYLNATLCLHTHVSENDNFSIDSAAQYLRDHGMFPALEPEAEDRSELQKAFVFYLVGIATFLYHPRPDRLSREVYSIEDIDTLTLHRYESVKSSVVSTAYLRRQAVRQSLTRFGHLFPITSAAPPETGQHDNLPLYVAEFNAHVMISILKMKIIWTDLIGAHLDFDERTNSVYIFKYPSFCLMNTYPSGQFTPTILRSCMPQSHEQSYDHAEKDIMKEILLSIHIIFGQNKKARRMFRLHDAFHDVPDEDRDLLLEFLCHQPWPFEDFLHQAKDVYHLPSDFPMLGTKLDVINRSIRQQSPTELKQLWRDNRNMLQWYTFWAVIILGVFGVTIGVVQIILAGIQVYYAARGGG